MKEIKEIIDGIAHSLNMTVDSLVKVYPQLRTEYSWYYTLGKLNELSSMFFVIIAVILAFVVSVMLTEHGRVVYRVPICIAGVVVVLLGITYVVTTVMQGFMCPDILIINKFID